MNKRDLPAELLASVLGDSNYLMPVAMLPLMDCDNCQHRQVTWRDGGHCYMFKDKPEGAHCGQFKKGTPTQ